MLRSFTVFSSLTLLIIFDSIRFSAQVNIRNRNRIDQVQGSGSGYTYIQWKHDSSAQRSAAKIIHMFREVILDMQRKMEAHYIIQQKWQFHRRFQLGEVTFDIRKKGSMISTILKRNLVWDNIKKEYLMQNRTENPKKDYLAIKDMARCQYEGMEIDKLVHMVEKYRWASLNSSNIEKKFQVPLLRTDNKSEKENKKAILRKQMKNININQEADLNKLVEHLEDTPEEKLKELLKKIGDGPQKPTKNIGDMRREGFKNIKKMVESNKKTSDDPKHPGDGFDADDDEAWK